MSGWPGRVGGAIGALLAIGLTGWISHALSPIGEPGWPWLIAPMGATAVLIFVLPASPLSQPWPVLGGHLLSAATGLGCHAIVPVPWLAAGLAVGVSITLMHLARCLHAPAGGTAIMTALAAPALAGAAWHFLVMPVALNAGLLVAGGWLWHRATGHSYPHHAAAVPEMPNWSGHIEDADLDAVLASWDELLDVSRADLLTLIHAVEARVLARQRPSATDNASLSARTQPSIPAD